MQALDNKTILVTGGAQGLGAAICRTLGKAGANVVVADLRHAQTFAGTLDQEGCKAHAVTLDVGNAGDVQKAIGEVEATLGRLDALINNAGTDVTLPIDELSVADWDRVLRTNLYGPFLMTKYVVEHWKRRGGGGHIVNIASTASRRAWPNAVAYHASKWGLLGLSHALHAELRPQGIKVTAVLAGGMRTPFLLDRFPDIDPAVLQDPVNVAETVRFVLSLPEETVIPEVMVLPMRETSWP